MSTANHRASYQRLSDHRLISLRALEERCFRTSSPIWSLRSPTVGRDSGSEAIRKAARDFDFAAYDTNGNGKLGKEEPFRCVCETRDR